MFVFFIENIDAFYNKFEMYGLPEFLDKKSRLIQLNGFKKNMCFY